MIFFLILCSLYITSFGIRFSNSTSTQPELIQDIEPLGITGFCYDNLRLTPTQKIQDEYDKTIHFMANLIQNETIPQFKGENLLLQFINYGDTELVYVLTVDNKKYTILISQPHNKPGTVKKEYENLKKLEKRFPNHITSQFYYAKDNDRDKELYVTPYLYQKKFKFDNKSILINHKARIPMCSEDIEKGIELGLMLREDNFLLKTL